MANILMFHRVLAEKLITEPNTYTTFGTLISQEYLERILSYLVENGFRFVTVSELINENEMDKLVALTFDDGYSDNFEFALPSLQKFNATATFFPIVKPCIENTVLPLDIYYECVDRTEMTKQERIDSIFGNKKKEFYWSEPNIQEMFLRNNFHKTIPVQSRVSYLESNQLKILADKGFEIGSHSMTHSIFTANYMNEDKMNFELKESKKQLEAITGKPVDSFCFPSGYYNYKAMELAKEAGYKSACLIHKKEKFHVLPVFERIFVKPNSIKELITKLK